VGGPKTTGGIGLERENNGIQNMENQTESSIEEKKKVKRKEKEGG
jgi:hypothetical protein